MANNPRRYRSRAAPHEEAAVDEATLAEFFLAARYGDYRKIKTLLDSGVPPTLAEPSTGFTLLHYIAARGIGAPVHGLLRRYDFDFLLRDHLGRLPSELAATVAEDFTLAGRLRSRELEQADSQGITLTYRPRPPATES
ncbi:ankyrin repeat domain-containing protein [Aquibaculum sediminis]|uniref:ankyrin repeat domain-containing protein n=1 Tax=Aquibaculum sediminis TaxID=3231907 RepID=UPI003451DB88